jgi:hypothetical protein
MYAFFLWRRRTPGGVAADERSGVGEPMLHGGGPREYFTSSPQFVGKRIHRQAFQ